MKSKNIKEHHSELSAVLNTRNLRYYHRSFKNVLSPKIEKSSSFNSVLNFLPSKISDENSEKNLQNTLCYSECTCKFPNQNLRYFHRSLKNVLSRKSKKKFELQFGLKFFSLENR